jgi:hypothetical protein
VTLTPCELIQFLKAAREELLTAWLGAPAAPDGAYLAQAWNAAEFPLAKDAPGRGVPLGKAPAGEDPVGRAPVGKAPPAGRPLGPAATVTPCCLRHDWKALSPAVVALPEAPAALLPPPQPASTSCECR